MSDQNIPEWLCPSCGRLDCYCGPGLKSGYDPARHAAAVERIQKALVDSATAIDPLARSLDAIEQRLRRARENRSLISRLEEIGRCLPVCACVFENRKHASNCPVMLVDVLLYELKSGREIAR